MLGQSLTIPSLALRPAIGGLDAGFTTGRYTVNGVDHAAFATMPGATLTRTGAGTASDLGGAVTAFATGIARITDRGLLIEEARTNKVTIFNANPTSLAGATRAGDASAVLTLVNDAAALAAAGLGSVVTSGQVFRLDNTAGTTSCVVTIDGATGNTNPHSLSGWVRGTGTGVRVRLNSVNTATVVPTPGYQRIITANVIPSSTINIWSIWADSGAVIWFTLPQLEEAVFVTSPIVTAGASATRGVDAATIAYGVAAGQDMTLYGEVEFARDTGATQSVLAAWLDAANHVWIHRNAAGTMVARVRIAGVNTDIVGPSRPGARTVKAALSRAGAVWTLIVDGGGATTATAGGMPGLPTLSLGSLPPVSLLANDTLRRVAVLPYAMTTGQMQVLTR